MSAIHTEDNEHKTTRSYCPNDFITEHEQWRMITLSYSD